MKFQALLISTLAISSLLAQEKPAAPASQPQTDTAVEASTQAPNISICYETFSMPLAMAAKLQRQQLADPELYQQIVAAVEKETARQESFIMLRAKSGLTAKTESVSEQTFPTEFAEPTLPGSFSGAANTAPSNPVALPAVPTAFETRNVGTTVEVEPSLGEDGQFVNVRMIPEMITQAGRESWGQGLATAQMPIFETQRIGTSINCHINQPFLLGTINRPPVSKVDPDSANRVWFAFVTTTLAEP